MQPPENPPEDLRTPADRVADVSPLVWAILGLAAVAGFIAMAFALTDLMNL